MKIDARLSCGIARFYANCINNCVRIYIYVIIRFVKGFIIETDYAKCIWIMLFLYLSLLQLRFIFIFNSYKCLKHYALLYGCLYKIIL